MGAAGHCAAHFSLLQLPRRSRAGNHRLSQAALPGRLWWIAPLMFPIEIISHLARMMSLTIRLYANMFASDLVTLVFFSLVPMGFLRSFWACTLRFADSGVRFHAAVDDLSVHGGFARALRQVKECKSERHHFLFTSSTTRFRRRALPLRANGTAASVRGPAR
jgi:hypothetical protein